MSSHIPRTQPHLHIHVIWSDKRKTPPLEILFHFAVEAFEKKTFFLAKIFLLPKYISLGAFYLCFKILGEKKFFFQIFFFFKKYFFHLFYVVFTCKNALLKNIEKKFF